MTPLCPAEPPALATPDSHSERAEPQRPPLVEEETGEVREDRVDARASVPRGGLERGPVPLRGPTHPGTAATRLRGPTLQPCAPQAPRSLAPPSLPQSGRQGPCAPGEAGPGGRPSQAGVSEQAPSSQQTAPPGPQPPHSHRPDRARLSAWPELMAVFLSAESPRAASPAPRLCPQLLRTPGARLGAAPPRGMHVGDEGPPHTASSTSQQPQLPPEGPGAGRQPRPTCAPPACPRSPSTLGPTCRCGIGSPWGPFGLNAPVQWSCSPRPGWLPAAAQLCRVPSPCQRPQPLHSRQEELGAEATQGGTSLEGRPRGGRPGSGGALPSMGRWGHEPSSPCQRTQAAGGTGAGRQP